MALTPDDVVNKRFQPTKFREGYDQDEVDDFLDEVVEELRRLNKENDELRAQLAGGAPGAEAVPAPIAAVAEPVPAAEEKAEEDAPVAQAEETPAAEAAPEAPVVAQASSAESAAGVLAMAQKLHDEYVTQGADERDRLVSEAQAKAAGLVSEAEAAAAKTTSEAEAAAAKTTSEAEETKRKTLAELERQKSGLEGQIEKLRGFENDYRNRLRTYIQGQLKDLDSTGLIGDEPKSGE